MKGYSQLRIYIILYTVYIMQFILILFVVKLSLFSSGILVVQRCT